MHAYPHGRRRVAEIVRCTAAPGGGALSTARTAGPGARPWTEAAVDTVADGRLGAVEVGDEADAGRLVELDQHRRQRDVVVGRAGQERAADASSANTVPTGSTGVHSSSRPQACGRRGAGTTARRRTLRSAGGAARRRRCRPRTGRSTDDEGGGGRGHQRSVGEDGGGVVHRAEPGDDGDLGARRPGRRPARRAAGGPPRRRGRHRPSRSGRAARRGCWSATPPPGAMAPEATNAAPSPFAAKPRSSSWRITDIVKQS